MKSKYIVVLCLLACIPLFLVGCKAKTTAAPTATPSPVMTNIELTHNLTTLIGTVATQGGAITNLATRVGVLETAPNLNGVNSNISALQAQIAALNAILLSEGANISALQNASLDTSVLNQSISNFLNTSNDSAILSRIAVLENTGVESYNLSYINASVWTLMHVPAVPPSITETLTLAPTWANSSYFVFCSAHDSVSSATLNYTWTASPNSLQIVPWLVDNEVLWYLPTNASGVPLSGIYTITCSVSDGIGGNSTKSTSITE